MFPRPPWRTPTARTPLFDDALPTRSCASPKSGSSFCRTLYLKYYCRSYIFRRQYCAIFRELTVPDQICYTTVNIHAGHLLVNEHLLSLSPVFSIHDVSFILQKRVHTIPYKNKPPHHLILQPLFSTDTKPMAVRCSCAPDDGCKYSTRNMYS
jgi:hypothetical protein